MLFSLPDKPIRERKKAREQVDLKEQPSSVCVEGVSLHPAMVHCALCVVWIIWTGCKNLEFAHGSVSCPILNLTTISHMFQ